MIRRTWVFCIAVCTLNILRRTKSIEGRVEKWIDELRKTFIWLWLGSSDSVINNKNHLQKLSEMNQKKEVRQPAITGVSDIIASLRYGY